MRKYLIKPFAFVAIISLAWVGCKKSNNPGGMVSPYISIFDVQKLYKGADVSLSVKNLDGSDKLAGVVVSDHSGHNLPEGLLIIQDRRRLNKLRGIAVNIGPDAANYVPGDSVHINVVGGKLHRVDGILQITNVSSSAVKKIDSNRPLRVNRVNANELLANPLFYENTLITVVKATFNPGLGPNDVLAGDKTVNDGTENVTLHTEAGATFANNIPPYSGNYTGILFAIPSVNDTYIPQHRIRTANDIRVLSSTPDMPDFVISGFMSDPEEGDNNYEYVQFRALKDINFATTPYSMVTTNNAGTSTPAGYPAMGWALAGTRTYKMELKSGTVSKGDFFYVGGTTKMINGPSSTSMAGSNWIASLNYSTTTSPLFYPGATDSRTHAKDKFLANSGNASGIAVFKGLEVRKETAPMDVVFIGSGGSLYQVGVAPTYGVGFPIGNTDVYDKIDPITGNPQPYYMSGTNKANFKYATGALVDGGAFNQLGGIFDTTLQKWVKARSQTFVDLSKTSTVTEIENAASTEIK
jgi:hypothetical protein